MYKHGYCFILLFCFFGHQLAKADPHKILTEILVVNQRAYEELDTPFADENLRAEVLKFLPHPQNPQYLAIWKCSISADEQAMGGKNCVAVSGGQYFEIKGLRDLEKEVEAQRLAKAILKEGVIFVATIPIGIGIYRGVVKGAQYAYAGAMAYRTVRWGAMGISLAAEIAASYPIDDTADRITKTGSGYAMGESIRCGKDRNCEERQAVVMVSDKVKLGRTFTQLNNYLHVPEATRKPVGTYSYLIKRKSAACRNCYQLDVKIDFKKMEQQRVY